VYPLDDTPVLGVSLCNVSLLRLDQTGGPAPGNKSFKLAQYLGEARRLGIPRLVSFGGVWSNHLHALAAAGQHHGFDTIGIVRGDECGADTAMLLDARRCGMRLLPVSRAEYRQRHTVAYHQQLLAQFGPCLLIPEGGASVLGASGCAAIAELIREHAPLARKIVVPVGTGTTLAGLVAGLDARCDLFGVSALKGAFDLDERVRGLLAAFGSAVGSGHCARWRILHDFHCGGFARVDSSLREFILAFEAMHRIALDPVYTGKMLYAIHQLRQRGEWDASSPVLAIHTGGLQGRRGYPWLTCGRAPVTIRRSPGYVALREALRTGERMDRAIGVSRRQAELRTSVGTRA
jgi:1-aminocyclopropane-1-carboxylate deaminase